MNGYLELYHLPYSGGFLEQDAHMLEKILLIKNIWNKVHSEEKED